MTTATSSDELVLSPDDLEHFETEGYVTLAQAVPDEQVSAALDAIWRFLGMDRNDPEDWYRPPHSPNSLVEIYQHQALWDNRQSPRIYRAFCQLWGTEKLWVSLDRACMKPPVDPKHPDWQWPAFMHWDFDLGREMPAQFGVQGVLCLSDTSEDQGGFHCIPGMHREVIEWSKTPPEQREPKVLPFERSRVRSISAKAGDMILWHRALPHGSGINRTNRPRIAQYILAAPAGYNVSIYASFENRVGRAEGSHVERVVTARMMIFRGGIEGPFLGADLGSGAPAAEGRSRWLRRAPAARA